MPRKTNTKRADGRYAVQVYLGTVDGKRKYKTVYGKTQREADEKAELLKIKLGKGLCISSDSFEIWTKHYLAAKQTEVSNNQYHLVASRTDYWVSVFGQV